MNDRAKKLAQLRNRARTALARGELTPPELEASSDPERLLEDLRIHQAELEIQNRELTEAKSLIEVERLRYRTLFAALPMPALVINRMGVIEETNQTAAVFFGFAATRILRRHSVFRLFQDRGGDWFSSAMHKAELEGEIASNERVPVLDGEGDTVPMDCLLLRLGSDYHADRHFLMLLIDRRVEIERDKERALHHSLMDNSDALIYAFDEQDRCVLMNRAAGRFFGVDSSRAAGMKRVVCMTQPFAERERRRDQRALQARDSQSEELRLCAESGQEHVFSAVRFVLRDEHDAAFAVAVIATDLTEQRRLQSRLDLATEIFSHGSEAILITDHNHRITFVNTAFEDISGFKGESMLGVNPLKLLSERQGRAELGKIKHRLDEKGFWEGEVLPRRRDGQTYPAWLRISRVRAGPDRSVHHVLVVRDISDQKLAAEEIQRLAFYDLLTGAPNRYLLHERTLHAIQSARRSEQSFALAFLDLDRFKEINDAFGHEVGDRLLVLLARRLQECLRQEDTIARLGGDEFVFLLENIDPSQTAERLQTVLEAAAQPFVLDQVSHQVSASIGVALYPRDGETFDVLLKNADTAMYQAKAAGRNTVRFFEPGMAEAASSMARIESEMRRGLKQGDFYMVYQPQVDLQHGGVVGAEALLRWQREDGQPISPGEFIPVAEQTGLINPLGVYVLDRVLAQLRLWQRNGSFDLPISINVAPEQFWREDFKQSLLNRIAEFEVNPDRVVLELTERTAMKMAPQAAAIMRALADQGIQLALDDFGTGYSSLAYLKKFPLRTLKIDRGFVQDLGDDADDQAICQAIIGVAHSLGLKVVAEGVETPAQAEFLRRAGCDYAQGFLYAPGLEAEAFLRWFARYEPENSPGHELPAI